MRKGLGLLLSALDGINLDFLRLGPKKTMSSFTPVRNEKQTNKEEAEFRHLNCEYTICSICIENICCIIYHVSLKYFFSGTKTGLDVYDPHFCKDQRSSLKGSSRQNSRQSCFAR